MKNHPSAILVTGARGLLGRNLFARLSELFPNARLCAVGLTPPRRADDPTGPVLDLSEADSWSLLPGPFDWVFHLAAKLPCPEFSGPDLFRANISMALACLESCTKWRTDRLVYASSIAVYPPGSAAVLRENLPPRPNDFYGASKLAGEHCLAMARENGCAVSRLRFSSVYGANPSPFLSGSVLYALVRTVQGGGNPTVHGLGTRTQDFLHVSDAAKACVDAASARAEGEFNVGRGVAVSMLELAEAVLAAFGRPEQEIEHVDAPEGVSVALDIGRARESFGFAPAVDLEQGIGQLA
jgi:UDP-glucose 4-epimerase